MKVFTRSESDLCILDRPADEDILIIPDLLIVHKYLNPGLVFLRPACRKEMPSDNDFIFIHMNSPVFPS